MHSAAANGNIDALELMLAKDQPVKHPRLPRYRGLPIYRVENGQCSSYLDTVLHTAVQAGCLESVRTLLQNQFDPDAFIPMECRPRTLLQRTGVKICWNCYCHTVPPSMPGQHTCEPHLVPQ